MTLESCQICSITVLLFSGSYGWKILSKGVERIRMEMIVVCSQVEAKTTEENCDVPQQITTSVSTLVSGGLCALSLRMQ